MTTDETAPADEPAVLAPVTRAQDSVKVSRAGRNLAAAIVVGLGLGGLVVLSLFLRKELFVLLATATVCVGVWELCQALKAGGFSVPLVPSLLGCVSMLSAAYVGGGQALAVCFSLTGVAILLWRVSDGVSGAARDVNAGLLVAAYPSLLAGFSSLMLAPADGAWRIFAFIATTVASDVGGYAVGVLAGRHPMAPTISPKKSWEGLLGSVAFCMVVGAACVHFPLHGEWWIGVVLGVVVAVAATLGDLAESTIKRDLGVKDMSNILPGHGGVMDRIDSVVVVAPVAWAVLTVLVPVSGVL